MVAISFEEFPRLTWSGVTSIDIAKRPIYLAIAIELSVFRITHLPDSVMTAILGLWIPVSILSIHKGYEALCL
jgi:thiamine transporter ThiT